MKSKCCGATLCKAPDYCKEEYWCSECCKLIPNEDLEPLLKLSGDYVQVEVEGIEVLLHEREQYIYIYKMAQKYFLMKHVEYPVAKSHGGIVCSLSLDNKEIIKNWRNIIWKIKDGKAVRI